MLSQPNTIRHPRSLVSIVIPCYKGESYLSQAIESCLRQTYQNLEIIVVDDASPDNCAEIAGNYVTKDRRVRLIRKPERGGAALAFNTGFAAASGEYFTRLAQDDAFREDAIDVLQRYLSTNPQIALTYCDMRIMDERGEVTRYMNVPDAKKALAWGNMIGLCVMWRRTVWEKLGGFDPNYEYAEDYDYWLRVRKNFLISKCQSTGPFYVRFHRKMGSEIYFKQQERNTLSVIRKHILSDNPNWYFRYVASHKMFSYHAFGVAYHDLEHGNELQALLQNLRSFFYWPFPYPSWLGRRYLQLMSILFRTIKCWIKRQRS